MSNTSTQDVAVTIHERYGGGTHQTKGWPVAPGLVIAPAISDGAYVRGLGEGRQVVPGRYVLLHVGSGAALSRRWYCRTHVEETAEIAQSCGVDWTRAPGPGINLEILAVQRQIWAAWRPCCAGWEGWTPGRT